MSEIPDDLELDPAHEQEVDPPANPYTDPAFAAGVQDDDSSEDPDVIFGNGVTP